MGLDLFMDLSYFDELERRIKRLLQAVKNQKGENLQAREKILALEAELKQQREENEAIQLRIEAAGNQPDLFKTGLVRERIEELLQKLEQN
ncbi:hypothetical protein KKA00_08410 [bacterium]|nr:hypothetical protein [bacterium]MBU1882496.1 hypothetical protein [bacterium]